MLKKYCFINQNDEKDCGTTCLAIISKHYGLRVSLSKLREIAGTDNMGTNVYGLIKCANEIGFNAKGIKASEEYLINEVKNPCIAHIIKHTNEGTLLHFIVIYKISNNKVIIADPAEGIVTYKLNEFLKIWTNILILIEPNKNFRFQEQNVPIIKRIFNLILAQKVLFVKLSIASIIYTSLGLIGSFYFKILIDTIIPNDLVGLLTRISIAFIGLSVIKNLMEFYRAHLILKLSKKLDIDILLKYYEHVMKLPLNFFATRKVGEIVSRFNDSYKLREAISSATLIIVLDTILALVSGIILYNQNSILFLICVIVSVLYCINVTFFNSKLKDINRKQMSNNSKLVSQMIESFNGIETIKAFNLEHKSINITENKFMDFMESVLKNGYINSLQGFLSANIDSIGRNSILWIGSYFVLNKSLTVGELLTFYNLMNYFLEPMKNLVNLQPMIQPALVAAERLYDILDLNLEINDEEKKKIMPNLKGDIVFKNVDFRYKNRNKIVNNININIYKGSKVALVGESGSGKSTLGKLLLNFHTIDNGNIYINGIDINTINKEYLRRKIAYVSQDIFLFNGTIMDNLTIGMSKVDRDKVIEICKKVKVHDFIKNFPSMYETKIEENGINLSGGEKQRIAIVRALLKNPDIIILDEATSNLDTLTEKAFEESINTLCKDITIITIAHRLNTITNYDKIFVLDNGTIKEQGAHDELIKNKDLYYSLWKNN